MALSSTSASASGIVFYGKGIEGMIQRFSALPGEVEDLGKYVVELVSEAAGERMKQIIIDGGENKTLKGGPRIISSNMYNSVITPRTGGASKSSRGRIEGAIGFADSAPDYTKFQERGTRSTGPARAGHKAAGTGAGGIPAMLAYATAQGEAIVQFQDLLDNTKWFASTKL